MRKCSMNTNIYTISIINITTKVGKDQNPIAIRTVMSQFDTHTPLS